MMYLTSAQIHLATNHLPVFGAFLATATLVVAAVTRRAGTRNLGLGLLVFAALSALPPYFRECRQSELPKAALVDPEVMGSESRKS